MINPIIYVNTFQYKYFYVNTFQYKYMINPVHFITIISHDKSACY